MPRSRGERCDRCERRDRGELNVGLGAGTVIILVVLFVRVLASQHYCCKSGGAGFFRWSTVKRGKAPTPNPWLTAMDLMAISVALLAFSAPLAAGIFKWKANGGKVNIREFHDFKEEVCDELRGMRGEMETLRILIQRLN